jgi:hypothetical protein
LAIAYPTAKITAKVLDENGSVLKGADVHISFEIAKKGGWGTENFGVKGTSDSEGFFTGEAKASSRIGITVRKDGYYFSRQLYEFTSKSTLLNRWEPWNPTIEVVLKKKRNPVGMYMGGGIIQVPRFDEPVGYDLEKGDWVAPYGKGMTSDFVVTFHTVSRAYTDYECNFTLGFSNYGDGIQEYFFDDTDQSYFKWPFMAPESGYASQVYKEKSDNPKDNFRTNEKKNVRYIYRVRTKKDANGNIVKAMYGKISQEFEFGPNGTILFHYYFNPDGTRNLEEDPKNNLFKK